MPAVWLSGGGVIKNNVYIENGDVLRRIAEYAELTPEYLARQAANAALDLVAEFEDELVPEVRGKIHVIVSPSADDAYWIDATVRTEPTVRRAGTNPTIRVDSAGRVLRSNRYVNAKEVPSMTAYVAQQMKIAFDKVIPRIRDRSSAAVENQLIAAAKAMGIKMTSTGAARAPTGGVELGGTFYPGGRFLPL